jgi:hypothetical protein
MKGQSRTCVITGTEFCSEDPNAQIEPTVLHHIVEGIKSSPVLRKEVITATLRDSACIAQIASAVLNVKATDIGLQYPGTVAEFFCRIRRELAKSQTPKVSAEVRKRHKQDRKR